MRALRKSFKAQKNFTKAKRISIWKNAIKGLSFKQ